MKNTVHFLSNKLHFVVAIVLVLVIGVMSVGFAYYSTELSSIGTISIHVDSDVIIETVILKESNNASYNEGALKIKNYEQLDLSHDKMNFEANIGSGKGDFIKLTVKITNVSPREQKFINFVNSSSLEGAPTSLPQPRMLNLKIGDILAPGETRLVEIIYYSKENLDNSYTLNGACEFIFQDGNPTIAVPTIQGAIGQNEFTYDRMNNNKVSTSLNILNLFNVSVKYSLNLNGTDNINLTDSSYISSNYANILDASESYNGNIYFVANLEYGESATGSLKISTENGETYNIDNVTISYGTPNILKVNLHTEEVSSSNCKKTLYGSSEHCYALVGDLKNESGSDITDFGILIQFKDNAPVNFIGNGTGRTSTYDKTTYPGVTARYIISSRTSGLSSQWKVKSGETIDLVSSTGLNKNNLFLGTIDGSDPWDWIEYITVFYGTDGWWSNLWSTISFGSDTTCVEDSSYQNVSNLKCRST